MPAVKAAGSYTWDSSLQRYRDSRGRIVARSTVRKEIDTTLDNTSKRARDLSVQLREGRVSLAEWETGMRAIVKDVHLYSAAAVRGGFDRMTPGDLGRVGQLVRTQYGYLERFAVQIATGVQPLNGYMLNRAAMYAQQGRLTHEHFTQSDTRKLAREQGAQLEMRNELGDADHCDECVSLWRRGWVPDGHMSLPGQRECKSSCHCTIERRLVGGRPLEEPVRAPARARKAGSN